MDPVDFIFCTGTLLGLGCQLRIFVRVYQFARKRGYGERSDFIESIRLRDTFIPELIGLIAAVVMCLTALQFR
jgi:hypothetical protein